MEAPKGDAIEIDELCVRKKGSLWLWIARSRRTGQVLAAVLGDRSWAMLERLWNLVPLSYRRKLVYTDTATAGGLSGYGAYEAFFSAWQHRITDKRDGRTSRVEGLNTLWRSRVSGLARRSCGVCVTRRQDVWERFQRVCAWHNRRCRIKAQATTSDA
jgi:IS1 family transposase